MKNCVYRFLNNNNEIIYIGKAVDLKNRMNNHTHLPVKCYEEKCKIEYTEFETEDDMDFAERYYILRENPKYNTVLSNKNMNISSFDLNNRLWKIYGNKNHRTESNIRENSLSYEDKLNLLNKDLELANMKYYTLDDLWKEDRNNELIIMKVKDAKEDLDIIQGKINKLKEDKIIDIVSCEEYKKYPKWLKELYLKYGYMSNEELLELKIQELKNYYIDVCSKQITQNGYYIVEDLISDVDMDFAYMSAYVDRNRDWVRLLDEENIFNYDTYFKVDTEVKNILVKKIIKSIEESLFKKFGILKKDIMVITRVHNKAERNPGFKGLEIEQAVIINKLINE